MRKLLLTPVMLLAGFYFMAVNAQCGNGRYYNKIFSPQSHTGILYGHATKFDGSETDLKMDIYEPKNDNFAHRPLIILAFGGSFTAGFRQSPDILVLCDEFCRRGYVTCTIDYRLGFEDGNDSDTNQFKALMRGVQDMAAAVRFFYKDVYTSNQYRIDTSQIFVGGVSAGAFMALNMGYGKADTTTNPPPSWVPQALIDVGGIEGHSGNEGYSKKVKGVIDLCGAIADTVWLMPGDPILVGVHGLADSLVTCYYDSAFASGSVESMLFGTGDIENRATHIGLTHSTYLFYGADHAPFVLPSTPYLSPSKEYMDTTIWVVRDFLYQNTVCDSALISGIADPDEDVILSVFPNPSGGDLNIASGHNKELVLDIYGVEGQLIGRKNLLPYSLLTISRNQLGAGIYFIQVSNAETLKPIKTVKAVLY